MFLKLPAYPDLTRSPIMYTFMPAIGQERRKVDGSYLSILNIDFIFTNLIIQKIFIQTKIGLWCGVKFIKKTA